MALDAARDILIESGPQAVTLKAVAGRIGRTHANLLHHFGSAAELQRELAAFLCHGVCDAIGDRMRGHAPGEHKVREIVDLAFDSFNQGGAGALTSWMLMTGNEGAIDPVVNAIHMLIDSLNPEAHKQRLLHEDTLALVLMALGDALIGDALSDAMALQRDTARVLATDFIEGRIAAFEAEHGIVEHVHF